jgi:hypothetical protein
MTDLVTYRSFRRDYLATTDDTPTTISTIPVPSSTTLRIFGEVIARRTGGTAGSAEDGAGYTFSATYKNVGGTATLIASTIDAHEDQAGWAVTFDASGSDALIEVTGAVDNNISWMVEYRIKGVTNV